MPPHSDTHLEGERVQIELLRKASRRERFARACSLSAMTISLSRRAIARANPDFTPRQAHLKFVELHYGKDLASRVRRYLERRTC
jgi:hypothetical protein